MLRTHFYGKNNQVYNLSVYTSHLNMLGHHAHLIETDVIIIRFKILRGLEIIIHYLGDAGNYVVICDPYNTYPPDIVGDFLQP